MRVGKKLAGWSSTNVPLQHVIINFKVNIYERKWDVE